ncbi:hypothetical protein K449DRAFT_209653 [Hypoxylon sp. EC38]|nr:hypothetical protein K449DRAFT_209653 [Hypoxylon sp. EC38]
MVSNGFHATVLQHSDDNRGDDRRKSSSGGVAPTSQPGSRELGQLGSGSESVANNNMGMTYSDTLGPRFSNSNGKANLNLDANANSNSITHAVAARANHAAHGHTHNGNAGVGTSIGATSTSTSNRNSTSPTVTASTQSLDFRQPAATTTTNNNTTISHLSSSPKHNLSVSSITTPASPTSIPATRPLSTTSLAHPFSNASHQLSSSSSALLGAPSSSLPPLAPPPGALSSIMASSSAMSSTNGASASPLQPPKTSGHLSPPDYHQSSREKAPGSFYDPLTDTTRERRVSDNWSKQVSFLE